MDRKVRHISPLIWIGLGLTLALLLLALLLAILRVQKSRLAANIPILGTVAQFTLTNQVARPYGTADLKGKVWVADIIFTRCAGPCLRMSKQMNLLQSAIQSPHVRFVSLTTDPEYDTPEVLQAYARKFDANPSRWMFLTGSKAQIRAVAQDSLKLTGIEKAPDQRASPDDLFIHSTIFVLVDKHSRLRGVFEMEGAEINTEQVRADIVKKVKALEGER